MSRSSKRVLPGFGLTLGSTLLCISLLTLLPLAALVFKASDLSIKEFWEYVSDPRAISTYKVTVSAALIALVVNLVTGVWIAWILVRYDFPGRRLLDALVDLPFALPTAVAGISLAALTGPYGPIGKLFAYWDIQIAYAFPGIVVAMIFTSFPFVIRTVQPVLEDLDVILEESSRSSCLSSTPPSSPAAVCRWYAAWASSARWSSSRGTNLTRPSSSRSWSIRALRSLIIPALRRCRSSSLPLRLSSC